MRADARLDGVSHEGGAVVGAQLARLARRVDGVDDDHRVELFDVGGQVEARRPEVAHRDVRGEVVAGFEHGDDVGAEGVVAHQHAAEAHHPDAARAGREVAARHGSSPSLSFSPSSPR